MYQYNTNQHTKTVRMFSISDKYVILNAFYFDLNLTDRDITFKILAIFI